MISLEFNNCVTKLQASVRISVSSSWISVRQELMILKQIYCRNVVKQSDLIC